MKSPLEALDFRFIDTAGIRDTKDVVESIGIKKTFEKIDQAQVVIYLFDSTNFKTQCTQFKVELEKIKNKYPQKPLIVLANKIDKIDDTQIALMQNEIPEIQLISAKTGFGVEQLTKHF